MQLSHFFQPNPSAVQSAESKSPKTIKLVYRGVSYQRCDRRPIDVAPVSSDRNGDRLIYRGATYAIAPVPIKVSTPISYLERQLLLYRGSTYVIGGSGF